jgi:hypothetical protein
MSETQKLLELRGKLIARRRALAESYQRTPLDQLSGESLTYIQGAIDAVDRAIADERRMESAAEETIRRNPLSAQGGM